MFEPSPSARVFGISPGVDFPRALVSGLQARLKGAPIEDLPRVRLIVNTARMQRRLRQLFAQSGATLLPDIRTITQLDLLSPGVALPPANPPLRRRLELIQLVRSLLDKDKTLAARASLYDLTDSLASLLDEMVGEGVHADEIAKIYVGDQSGHWERALKFIHIAQEFVDQTKGLPDTETRQRALVDRLCESWAVKPPRDPVIVAGSTGSRGTTLRLMEAVSKLPQGAIVLPGFDFEMSSDVWEQLNDQKLSEDHPQYRFHRLMQILDLGRRDIEQWADIQPVSRSRNSLISLSLRPAPFTDAWLTEGPRLDDLTAATKDITLVQAPSPRAEALAIALRLRQAAETGETAALITPDRMLTRQVSAALDQWGILPDDSAGTPLHLTPPGRFLRHIVSLFARRLESETLLTLLKHPLTHGGPERSDHQKYTQQLELAMRAHGLPYPSGDGLAMVMANDLKRMDNPGPLTDWLAWVSSALTDLLVSGERPLADWVGAHITVAERLANGPSGADGEELWRKKTGEKARAVLKDLETHADAGGLMDAQTYADLIGALLAAEEVRDRDAPHPDIMIWGTLEARVQGADLVILGGLNDGTWPEAPKPDPWLNRSMRQSVGLLLPERRIGLSAHDYQQAVAAPKVWITRAIRSDDAQTVASRWLNRLENLMNGLPERGGQEAFTAMVARGNTWLEKVATFEHFDNAAPAQRPSPQPPVTARPRELSVTEIKTLIRDPYAIYARHVLGLRKLGDLAPQPDARFRGTLVHTIAEQFVKETMRDSALLTADHLMQVARDVLEQEAPWPTSRAIWMSRVQRVSELFVASEQQRRLTSTPFAFEDRAKGLLTLSELGFSIKARADRIDQDADGRILLYDYKTGSVPTENQQLWFDKQLLIMAAMVEEGAFQNLDPAQVADAIFIGLGNDYKESSAPFEKESAQTTLAKLRVLLSAYLTHEKGFTARLAMERERFGSDYDQLARYGEWNETDAPEREDLS